MQNNTLVSQNPYSIEYYVNKNVFLKQMYTFELSIL